MTGELWEQLTRQTAASIAEILESRIAAFFERHLRKEVKLIYSEKEAAAFLGVSKDTLASWRKRKHIAYIHYPKGRLPKDENGEEQGEGLGDTYAYRLVDMLSFADTYLQDTPGRKRYAVRSTLGPLGAEIEDKRLRAVG